MKLNQVIAISKSVKANADKEKTEVYQTAQKPALFQGISRVYEPISEEGYVYPPERQNVQYNAKNLITQYVHAGRDKLDFVATQDYGNCEARADVIVDGKVVLSQIPVTYLLFLEKELEHAKTVVLALPVLDPSESWKWDADLELYVTEPKLTTKTKKVTKPVVLYEATPQHPAQVKEVSEDIPEGTWRTIKMSGAISPATQREYLKKIEDLSRAVIFAREQANSIDLQRINVSVPLFQHIFGTI